MLKKSTAILLLVLANLIILAHNFVPHHHHHDNADLTHEHDQNHHEKKDEANNLFSNIFHGDSGFTFISIDNNNQASKSPYLFTSLDLLLELYVGNYLIPPLLKSDYTYLNQKYQSPHSCTSGLRGPPSILS